MAAPRLGQTAGAARTVWAAGNAARSGWGLAAGRRGNGAAHGMGLVRRYIKMVDLSNTPYADGPADAARERVKREVVAERRQWTKNNLLSTHLASIMANSSLTLFVSGDANKLETKAALAEVGFKSKRVKSSLIKIAARRLDEEAAEDAEHILFAEALSRGLTSILYMEEPLMTLCDAKRRERLEAIVPFGTPKKGVLGPNQKILVGAFIKDSGKDASNIWLTQAGTRLLFDSIKERAGHLPADALADLEPHALFHANLVSKLRGQLGVIRAPLTASGRAISALLAKPPASVAHTFAKIKALRAEEEDQGGNK